jgi:hypothetical protein
MLIRLDNYEQFALQNLSVNSSITQIKRTTTPGVFLFYLEKQTKMLTSSI